MSDPAKTSSTQTSAAGGSEPSRFFPVPVDALDHAVLQMDLYIKFADKTGLPTLYRSAGLAFTPQDTKRLVDQKVKFLYVSAAQHHIFRKALTERLDRTFTDPTMQNEERGRVIREACSKMIEDVLLFPGDPEPVAAINDIARNFSDWSSSNPDGFSYLLNMSAHDFYTATHMVNVGTGCGLLAKELHPEDRDLFQLCVQGGLLHDIGKRKIPPAILNKEGKLSPEEWKTISRHPTDGFEELKKNPAIPALVLSMVRDHHERLDGKGYPNGISGVQISEVARICAIVDVFDAITAARPYRGPTPPMDTLKIMRDGRGNQFDADMFDAWAALVTRMMEADPARGPASTGVKANVSLESMLVRQQSLNTGVASESRPTVNLYDDERRRHKRHDVSIHAVMRLVRSGKTLPIAPGETTTILVMDVSRGGLQIKTPWPLSQNDLLNIEFEVPGQAKKIARLCKVMRVRRTDDAKWAAGLSFMETEAEAA